MNWIANFVRPKIKSWLGRRSDTPENLWTKCPGCGEMIVHKDLVAALYVCPQCGFHLRVGPKERFAWTFDAGS
jgi:acetyl-CoA carboxylase carboxyl transferase subunit beta